MMRLDQIMADHHRWLTLNLEGPLLAFGGVAIDHIGVTRDFPALSMLTGLIANALGYHRTDWQSHQALQDRLVFAARCDREQSLGVLTDVQNAKLGKADKGWTTFGVPEGRDGGSHDAPHRRQRDYHMDAMITVVLRLTGFEVPSLEDVADAVRHPARPLFIGRKPCLPSTPLISAKPFVEAADGYSALASVPGKAKRRAIWPDGEGPVDGDVVDRIIDLPDRRNWRTGLHGGSRLVVEGRISPLKVTP